ncbi:hypothetical protein T484DRAFT_1756515 [Baffinella frigidus]|nr:hypothetical protein T484DRAFT_1756515 [Cryptophyta sp. CCMP2293]
MTKTNRETTLQLILTNTEIAVKSQILDRYQWAAEDAADSRQWFECISMFINVLTVLNLQTSTMCLEVETCMNPYSGERNQPDKILKLGRWKAAAAILATATLTKSIHMIGILAFKPQDAYYMTTTLETMWKYMIVECAARALVDETTTHSQDLEVRIQQNNRKFRMTIYEYFFGPPCSPNTFDRDRMERPDVYLSTVSDVLTIGSSSISKLLSDSRGTAILMFSIRRQRRTISEKLLYRHKLKIPGNSCTWSNDVEPTGQERDGNFIERTEKLFKKIYLHIAPEVVTDARFNALNQSELGNSASSSAVIQKMRARTQQDAVKAMLRLPVILNEMELPSMRKAVGLHLQRARLSEHPLGRNE